MLVDSRVGRGMTGQEMVGSLIEEVEVATVEDMAGEVDTGVEVMDTVPQARGQVLVVVNVMEMVATNAVRQAQRLPLHSLLTPSLQKVRRMMTTTTTSSIRFTLGVTELRDRT